jgi:hypothetical protein
MIICEILMSDHCDELLRIFDWNKTLFKLKVLNDEAKATKENIY